MILIPKWLLEIFLGDFAMMHLKKKCLPTVLHGSLGLLSNKRIQ